MKDLIEKLQALTEETISLSGAFFCQALHRVREGLPSDYKFSPMAPVPNYIGSVEAALLLVPKEWTAWGIESRSRKTRFVGRLSRMSDDSNEEEVTGHGKTPALALCIVALKARPLPAS